MERKSWNRIGMVAIIVLAPGGFLLGATLAANAWRRRKAGDATYAVPVPDIDNRTDAGKD